MILFLREYNAQGDVIGLIDANANEVVNNYTYDSWGKVVSIGGSLASTVGQKNEFRYRGYWYDGETGLYYLQSRYYSSDWSRFVNADTVVGVPGVLLSGNIFEYCGNNAVNMVDSSGYDGQVIGLRQGDVLEELIKFSNPVNP